MVLCHVATSRNSDRRRRPRARRVRGGAISAVLPMLLVLGILGSALVLNWSYLVLVNRDLQRKCDLLALAGAPELLDENLLRDRTADPQECLRAAAAAVDVYRRENNRIGGRQLRVAPNDVEVRSAFVADVRHGARRDYGAFDDPRHAPAPNALFVGIARRADGDHPVRYLWEGCVPSGKKADVTGGSWALLDNLVVGFRPTATVAAPLLPLAIDADAWHEFRTQTNQGSDQFPHGGNGIRELMLQLRGPDAPGKDKDKDKGKDKDKDKDKEADANAVLVDFTGSSGPFQAERLADQILRGVAADEVPQGLLGPIGAGRSLVCRARRDASEDSSLQLAFWINAAIEEAEASGTLLKRALPLYRSQHPGHGNENSQADAPVELVGWVACSILGAASDPVQHRLTVWVEPSYLIHDTVWTVPAGDEAPERNPYLYRLRLIE